MWLQPNKGAPTLMLFSVVGDRSGVAYQEYRCVYGEGRGSGGLFDVHEFVVSPHCRCRGSIAGRLVGKKAKRFWEAASRKGIAPPMFVHYAKAVEPGYNGRTGSGRALHGVSRMGE